MDKITRTALLLATVAFSMVLTALPALATEGTPTKIELPKTEHDRVGLFILGAMAIFAVLALLNARRQLRGERGQADGKFRWR